MIEKEIAKELKAIRDMVQDGKRELNSYTDGRDDKNESEISDTQNATCELSEELDQRITDIENALCELTEE